MATDWNAVRKHFPTLDDWTYLNSATYGPVPNVAVEAMTDHFSTRDRTASLDFLSWYDRADRIRDKLALWIGGHADGIAFLPSAGVGLSWILHGLQWTPGDRILTLDDEFPNNLYATALMERYGVEIDRVPGGTEFVLEKLMDAVGDRTRLVLMSALDYASGLRPPLEVIGREARRRGALFVVDGTQGVGAIPVDVERQSIDALICHGYKWLCCPTGIGFLYVSEPTRKLLTPITVSWRSHRDWRDVDHLHHGSPDIPTDAAKLEGGILNFSGLFALEAVMDLFSSIGADEIFDRVGRITASTQEVLRRAGGVPNCDRCEHFDSPVVAAAFDDVDVSEMSGALRQQQIAVSARHGRLRVSPHFFNNDADLSALEQGIAEYRRQTAP